LERGSNVTAELQAGSLPPTNGGRPDAYPASLYIRTYPVSSCWLFEQCSKFNPHPYVHAVRPEFGDRELARSNSPNYLCSDNIPTVTGLPLTGICYIREIGRQAVYEIIGSLVGRRIYCIREFGR
jgi:hypothetical protein